MYLQKLEIQGFKSFASKTTLEFNRDLTAIVGPNGSGKSNIADAVRWVLGEQNPRHLRGQLMEDLVFVGSDSRKPVGMAEVTLTLTNDAVVKTIRFTRDNVFTADNTLTLEGEDRLVDRFEIAMPGLGFKTYQTAHLRRLRSVTEE